MFDEPPADPGTLDVERRLLAAVAEAPDDNAPREVLGDLWLRGDDPARGELIARQLAGLDTRDLEATHGARWRAPATALGFAAAPFVRGTLAMPLVIAEDTQVADLRALLRLSPRLYVGRAQALDLDVIHARIHGGDGVFAIKRPSTPGYGQIVTDEHALLDGLRHPHVVELVGQAVCRMPWGDEVANVIRWAGRPIGAAEMEPYVRAIGAQIAETLADLHARGIVHTAIRPDHVLVDDDDHVRLCGFAAGPRGRYHRKEVSRTRAYDMSYLAPEIVRNEPGGPPADVYGLYRMLTGRDAIAVPESAFDALYLARDQAFTIDDTMPLAPLLRRCLVRDPDARPTAAQVAAELVR